MGKIKKKKKKSKRIIQVELKVIEVKHFHLQRDIDESGMSGTGRVSEGVVLPNGLAVMWWLVEPHSVQIYPSIDDLERIHSHNKGTTHVVYDNSTPAFAGTDDKNKKCEHDWVSPYDTVMGEKKYCKKCNEFLKCPNCGEFVDEEEEHLHYIDPVAPLGSEWTCKKKKNDEHCWYCHLGPNVVGDEFVQIGIHKKCLDAITPKL